MNKKEKTISQSFMKGTIVLTASIFVVKVLGILFRIFVTGMIGATGAAYFTVAYEIYNPLFALATAGLPIAISRMVSENMAMGKYKNVRLIHKVSIPIFLTTGSIGFLLMILGAIFIPKLPFINVPGAIYSVLALAPTILFACLMSIYRGYHQGLRDTVPTAISEIIEASCKFFVGYAISYSIIKFGMNEYLTKGTVFGVFCESKEMAKGVIMPYASAGAIVGISLGAFMGFLYLLICHKKRGDGISNNDLANSPDPAEKKVLMKKLISTAVPIGIGAIIMNVAGLIDTTLILNRIQNIMNTNPQALLNCYGVKIANEMLSSKDGVHGFLLGCYSFTLPIMMLIPAITQVFGVVSLPAVTSSYTKNNKLELKRSIESVIKMTTLVTIPAGIGISLLGPSLLSILYPHKVTEVNIASNIIPFLGIATILTATSTPLCSMLQAVGRVDLPVKIISLGLAIKIIVNYLLVGIPEINIQGAGIGTIVGYLFILVVSMYFLIRETKIVPNFNVTVLKPLLAGIVCGLSAFILNSFLLNIFTRIVSIIFAVFFAIIVYFFTLFLLKAVTVSDIKSLPKGESILKILNKCIKFIK